MAGLMNVYPYLNPDLPLEERVNDLISRFTPEEKIKLMCQYQAAIPRLGVAEYKHGTEGAHGIAWLGEATSFPQNTGLACTWNPELLQRIGAVIGDEARVYYQRNPAVNGLTIWAPTVDMERDPRWGRTEEAYGEDPHLTGTLTTGLVQGLQGDHPFYYRAVGTLKHFYANNNEKDRGSASVSIDPRNKREYYLKAFEPAVRLGRAGSMMTAYNGINGTPCNLNHEVTDIVKGEWGMDGFVVSDAGDVLGTVLDHHYAESYAEAVAGSVKAGIDSITDERPVVRRALHDALERGLLTEADLDRALRNTFRVRFRLGEFDSAEQNPYSHVPDTKLCAPEHAALSLTAAREAIVLLKNDGLLPLGRETGSVAVLGPLADEAYTDWYSGTPPYRVTPLQGVAEKMSGRIVHFRTGLDRIRLRSASDGKYVGTAPSCGDEDAGAVLKADREDARYAEIFEYGDWGWGSVTLRALSSGRYVTESDRGLLTATAEEAGGWFVKEAFCFEKRANGTVTMKSWEGRPIMVDRQGRVTVDQNQNQETASPSGGCEFIIEVVQDGIEQAVEAAKSAETAIVFVGSNPFINGKETIDRPDITLPASQQALIRAVWAANPRTVLVIVGSYPFAVNWENDHVPAIVFTVHGGQELGHAVADALFGDYNPGGRLNMTWYKSASQLPGLMEYDIIKGKRTYQYFDGEVLYPFGHGLSYTRFEYGGLSLSRTNMRADGKVTVSVRVRNAGLEDGDEVVQMYVRRADSSRVVRPLKTLKGYKRIKLAAGEEETVTFELKAEELAFWDVTRERYCIESGKYVIMIGPSSSPSSGQAALEALINVEGETVPPRTLDHPVRAVNYDDYHQVYLDECREGGESIRPVQGHTGIGRQSGDALRMLNGLASGWIAFHDVEFARAGNYRFEARVSGHLHGGEIAVLFGSPDEPAAAICEVIPTGGRQAWTTVSVGDIPVPGGRHKVYLVIKGEAQMSWFRLSPQQV